MTITDKLAQLARVAEAAQAVTTDCIDKIDYFKVPSHLMAALALALDEYDSAPPAGLPSLPEPFDHIHTLENSGDTDDVPVFTADQMLNYARRAIESRAIGGAEPVAYQVAASFWQKLESIPAALRGEAVPLYAHPTDRAPERDDEIRAALSELVAVKDLKERVEALHFAGPLSSVGENWKAEYDAGRREYIRRQPAAWDAARKVLSHQSPALRPEPEAAGKGRWIACTERMPENDDEAEAIYGRIRAAASALASVAAAQLVPETLYVECHECSNCGHAGINDTGDDSSCNTCEWSGPSPKEDRCPGCDRIGTMCTACPECGSRYTLVAEATLAAPPPPAAQQAAEPAELERRNADLLRLLSLAIHRLGGSLEVGLGDYLATQGLTFMGNRDTLGVGRVWLEDLRGAKARADQARNGG